jgi:predicted O-linked N-acetylglucosamine transferase (SPINDLY family)
MSLPLQQLLQQAIQYHQAGRGAQAERLYREILAAAPGQADALHLLGLLAHQKGDSAGAINLICQAIAQRPDVAEFHLNLGNVFNAYGQADEAVIAYQRAIALKPALAIAWSNLGAPLLSLGRAEESRQAAEKALQLDPSVPEAHVALASALALQNRFEQAAGHFQKAIELRPQYVGAHVGLAKVLQQLGRASETADAAQRATQLAPGNAEAWRLVGTALRVSDPSQALDALRRSADLDPSSSTTWNLMAGLSSDRGDVTEAIAYFRRALAADPTQHATHSNFLLALHYDDTLAPEAILQEHIAWAERFADPLTPTAITYPNTRDPDRRLRIGYVSGDFRRHPVAALTEPFLACHEPSQVEVFCYSVAPESDEITERLKRLGHAWRDVAAVSDEHLAALIRQDAIDILVDLSGHTAHNRLLTFARKPAPIQIAQLGYPDTTGMRSIDYHITDAHADPPGVTDRFHTEKLVRFPRTLWCYQPWTDQAVAPLPARGNGFVTFGSLNNMAKITPRVLDAWAMIMARIPSSRLALPISSGESEASDIRARFQARGIDQQRLDLIGRRTFEDYMRAFNDIDVALDPFPYNGGVSSFNALWMGVPVLTLAGTTRISRAGLSILNNLDMPEWIAGSIDDYIERAVGFAGDLDQLEALRRELRPRMLASPLMDAKGYTRALERAYRIMWKRYCEGKIPERFDVPAT